MHAGRLGDAVCGLDMAHIDIGVARLRARMEGHDRHIAAALDVLQQLDRDMLGRTELGGKVVRRGGAVTRQHETHRHLDGMVIAHDCGDLGHFLTRVHREAAAAILAVGIKDLAAGLHRIVVVEMRRGLDRMNQRHLVNRSDVPVGEARLGQSGDDLARGVGFDSEADGAREAGSEHPKARLQPICTEAEHRFFGLHHVRDRKGVGVIEVGHHVQGSQGHRNLRNNRGKRRCDR